MSAIDRGDWMATITGGRFFPLDPQPDDVRIADIAHALAHLCRFAGHTREFYSVAQHSVLVSEICGNGPVGLWGLLHDASEAYLCDLTRPVKKSFELQGYRLIEANVMATICQRFNLPLEMPTAVKEADSLALEAEKRDLMVMPSDWTSKRPAHHARVRGMFPPGARTAFLRRFDQLASELGLRLDG